MLAIYDISNKLTFDLLTLKLVSESRVTWATSVPIFSLLCSRVRPDVRDKQTDRRQTSDRRQTRRQTDVRRQTKASLNASTLWGGGIIMNSAGKD